MISLCMGSQHTLPYVDVVYKNGRGKVAMLFSTKSLAWSHLSFPHIEPILIVNWPTEILNALVLMFFVDMNVLKCWLCLQVPFWHSLVLSSLSKKG